MTNRTQNLFSALALVSLISLAACGGGGSGSGSSTGALGGGSGDTLTYSLLSTDAPQSGPLGILAPATPAFGVVPVGTAAVTIQMVLLNSSKTTSAVDVYFQNPADAQAHGYALNTATPIPCGATLSFMATCQINIDYTPTAAGATGETLVVSDGINTNWTIALTGTGR